MLKTFIQEREGKPPAGIFGTFERDRRSKMAAIERDLVAEEQERLDVEAPIVLIDGVTHRRVLRCEETYLSAAGPVRVERTLYSTRRDGERAASAPELRASVVEKYWTPLAAEQAAFMVAHMTSQESDALCAKLGHMQPSESSLDRLPKQLSGEWERQRESFEKTLRADEIVPVEAVTVAVSLDGVLVPMRDGAREEKRAQAAAEGRPASGTEGYQEVERGTLSFYDAAGDRVRYEGGQAILTFRSVFQSERFNDAWALLATTYKAEVTLLENVITLSDYRRQSRCHYGSTLLLHLATLRGEKRCIVDA